MRPKHAHAAGAAEAAASLARAALAAVAASLALVLAGCAHPINVEPDMARVAVPASPRIAAKVALRLTPETANIEVTTTGGGGDSVRYQPYAAMRSGYLKMLGDVFESVVPLPMQPATAGAVSGSADYTITPVVTTNSGGSNVFTWPPETFTVDLTSEIRDSQGRMLASPRVVGNGQASTGERLADHGFSGRRAFEDALRKAAVVLQEWGAAQARPPASSTLRSAEERLQRLKSMLDNKLLSEKEYEEKRRAVLADL